MGRRKSVIILSSCCHVPVGIRLRIKDFLKLVGVMFYLQSEFQLVAVI